MRLSSADIEFLRKALEEKGIFETVQDLHDKNPSILEKLCDDILNEIYDKGVPGWNWNDKGDMVRVKGSKDYNAARHNQATGILEYLNSNEYHVGNEVFLESSNGEKNKGRNN